MNCDDFRGRLSAWLDGEQEGEAAAQTDAHLSACADCAAALQDLVRQEAKLRRLFAEDRGVGERIAERVLAAPDIAPHRPERFAWFQLVPIALALAAGFLLAILLPWPRAQIAVAPSASSTPTATHPAEPAGAQLALATGGGVVEVKDARGWRPMPTGEVAPVGCSIRTPEMVTCELKLPGVAMRLNGGTEIQLVSHQKVQLGRGQMWANVNAPKPFEVAGPTAAVSAKSCRFDYSEKNGAATVTAYEGSAQTRAGGTDGELAAGHQLRSEGGKHETLRVSLDEMVQSESWLNELLMRKGPADPELQQRVECLFAKIGQSKMDYLREEELRILGESCVLPLLRYLQGPESKGDLGKRRLAGRVIGDLAPPWAIFDLIGLLKDEDVQVRASAASALLRLTGQDQGLPPRQWSNAAPEACGAARDGWQDWWKRNSFRCPSSPDDPNGANRSLVKPDKREDGGRRGRAAVPSAPTRLGRMS